MICIIIRITRNDRIAMNNSYPLFFIFCYLLTSNSWAQPSEYELDSMVTTGTRTPKLLSDSPVAVQVITAEQLSLVSSGTLAEALNFIPGVVVTRSEKDGYNIQMLGFDGDHILVLVNGQRVISPSGSRADLDQLSAMDVERIEVLKGAASVMYGSAAMGGVLNIITKPRANQQTTLSYELASFGSNAIKEDPLEHRFKLTTNTKTALVEVQLNYQHINNPGFKYNQESQAENGTSVEKHFVDLSFAMNNSLGKWVYRPQFFTEEKYRQEEDTVVPEIGVLPDAYTSKVERISHSLHLDVGQSWQSKIHYAQHEEASGHESKASRDMDITIAGFENQMVWMTDLAEVVSGLELDYEEMNIPEDNLLGENRSSVQYFLQSDWFLANDFELLSGYRLQKDTGYGVHQAGRVSAVYRQQIFSGNQLSWRFGVGESYKVPSLKEQHYVLDHSNIGSGYVVIGNEDLVPEETVSYNFSASLEGVNDTQLELSFYHADSKNFIENEFSQTHSDIWGVDAYVYQNIAEVQTQGGDLSFSNPVSASSKVQLNYSYVEARDGDDVRLSGRPRHQFKVNYQTRFNWLNTQLITYAVYQADEAYTEEDPETQVNEGYLGEHNNAWVSLNLSLTQQPTKNLTTRFGIQNILDEHRNTSVYETQFDARPEDSRRIYLGLTYQL